MLSLQKRTVHGEGSRITWELVVPLFVTVELLNDHCVFNYQAICAYIFTKKIITPTIRILTLQNFAWMSVRHSQLCGIFVKILMTLGITFCWWLDIVPVIETRKRM